MSAASDCIPKTNTTGWRCASAVALRPSESPGAKIGITSGRGQRVQTITPSKRASATNDAPAASASTQGSGNASLVSNEVIAGKEAILAEDVARDRYLRTRDSLTGLGATTGRTYGLISIVPTCSLEACGETCQAPLSSNVACARMSRLVKYRPAF